MAGALQYEQDNDKGCCFISRRPPIPRARECCRWKCAGTRRPNGINPWTAILRISCTSCPRWKLRSRKFGCERHCPTRCSERRRAPGEETVGLGPSEDAASLRWTLQEHDRAGAADEHFDGPGGRVPAIDHRDDHGLHQRFGAHAFDSDRHGARGDQPAVGALCADEPARAGAILPDSRRHRCS